MRIIFFILVAAMTISVSAQEALNADQWREDLRFLQQTVHKDYPFLFKKTTKADFDTAVEKLYDEIPKLEQHEIIIGMAKIVSSFNWSK